MGERTLKLSENEHKQIDTLLNTIFDAQANGDLTKRQAIAAIAHVMAAIAIGNEEAVRSWIGNPQTFQNYMEDIRAART